MIYKDKLYKEKNINYKLSDIKKDLIKLEKTVSKFISTFVFRYN